MGTHCNGGNNGLNMNNNGGQMGGGYPGMGGGGGGGGSSGNGYDKYRDDVRWHISQDAMHQQDGQYYCESIGMRLAAILNEREMEIARETIRDAPFNADQATVAAYFVALE